MIYTIEVKGNKFEIKINMGFISNTLATFDTFGEATSFIASARKK